MRTALIALATTFAIAAAMPAAAAEKFVWDGYGTGVNANCSIYGMHIEFVVQNGRAIGWWQQKDRVVRNFDLPVGADGKFAGKVNIGPADMNVSGTVGSSPAIQLRGYCDFGGPLKKL